MNKRITSLLLAIMIMTATACATGTEKKEVAAQPYLEKIEYSNLSDDQTIKEIQKVMEEAGIAKENQNLFFENVKQFNESVKKEHLTSGYEITDLGVVKYDPFVLQDEWRKSNPDFEGYNCRITSFQLFSDFLDIDINSPKNEEWILTDLVSISSNEGILAKEGELDQYKVLYSTVKTEKTQDVNVHVKNVQEDWKNREIKFKKNPKASLITVFFHEDLDKENNLFIGHAGILFQKAKDELYFVEKVAFQEPYQAIKFKNRTELNDYLMNKYDIEWGQMTAKPFIMENDQLLEGYRANPKNAENSGK